MDSTSPNPGPDHPRHSSSVSRRRLLTGAAAGAAGAAAGAVALGASPASATIASPASAATIQTHRADRFGRIFPDLPSFAPANDEVRAAMMDIGRPGGLLDANDALDRGPIDLIIDPALSENNRNNEFHTAGTTFLGQFLDHDITFDITSPLGIPTEPEDSPNTRTPALDLDSVYGGGPTANPIFYEPDRVKLRIESGGLFEDLPRESNGTAIISDPRNDENLMVAGLHAAFILFHNRVVDQLRSEGVPEQDVFAEARRLVTWHYQWIIIHEFLALVDQFGMRLDILQHGRRFYRPEPGPAFIPVEFQNGIYRFGHSMVRPSYRANLAGDNGGAFFGMIFDPAGEGQADPVDLRGEARAPRRFIGWQTFFDFGDGEVRPNKRIDRRISTPLFRLPLQTIPTFDPPTALMRRNLLRHLTWELPSGQMVANELGWGPLTFPELAQYGLGLENSTPLFYYNLGEAELIGDGITLGPMGARIVSEVVIGLVQLDPTSFLSVDPSWTPTLPSQTPGDFRVTDLLRFARVDPASRGQ